MTPDQRAQLQADVDAIDQQLATLIPLVMDDVDDVDDELDNLVNLLDRLTATPSLAELHLRLLFTARAVQLLASATGLEFERGAQGH